MSNFFNYDDDKVNCAEKADFKTLKTKTNPIWFSKHHMDGYFYLEFTIEDVKYLDIFKNNIKRLSHLIHSLAKCVRNIFIDIYIKAFIF